MQDFNTFLGIVILTAINSRKSQRDYWSTDPFLHCEVIKSAMSRDDFERIKSKLKFSKSKDKDDNDRGWRIRAILEMFRKNIQSYGYFQTAISVDETMVKSYARTSMKQFIRGKPIRFGLKFWTLCTQNGFLLIIIMCCPVFDPNDGHGLFL